MNLVWISSSGVPMMPVVLTSSRQGGTPHLTKKFSEDASIHLLKLGKKTMPAGSQSPNITSTSYTTVFVIGEPLSRVSESRMPQNRLGRACGIAPRWGGAAGGAGGLPCTHAQRTVQADHFAVEVVVLHDVAGQFGEFAGLAQSGREGDAGGQ